MKHRNQKLAVNFIGAFALSCFGTFAMAANTAPAQIENTDQSVGDATSTPYTRTISKTTSTPKSARKILYKPPHRGAPDVRIAGGSRGFAGDDGEFLTIIAPEHVAYTIAEQPILYWYTSQPSAPIVEITVIDQKGFDPLLEKTLEDRVTQGIHALDLSRYHLHLKEGVQYQWFVSLVKNPAQRSSDLLSGGMIERIAPSPDLKRQLATATAEQLPYLFAEHGLWYDAYQAVETLIGNDPENGQWQTLRQELLEQAGLKNIAP